MYRIPRHRAPWTVARRMSDRLFAQVIPGRHHVIWSVAR